MIGSKPVAFVDRPHAERLAVRRAVEGRWLAATVDIVDDGPGFNVRVDLFGEDYPSSNDLALALDAVGFRLEAVDPHGNRFFTVRCGRSWTRVYRAAPAGGV